MKEGRRGRGDGRNRNGAAVPLRDSGGAREETKRLRRSATGRRKREGGNETALPFRYETAREGGIETTPSFRYGEAAEGGETKRRCRSATRQRRREGGIETTPSFRYGEAEKDGGNETALPFRYETAEGGAEGGDRRLNGRGA